MACGHQTVSPDSQHPVDVSGPGSWGVTEDVHENEMCAKVEVTIGESLSILSVSASPLPG